MTVTIKTHCDDSILGAGEYIPELTIRLTENGHCDIAADERHSAHNGTPMDEWRLRTISWSVSLSQGCMVVANAAAVEALAEKIKPLLERVHAGHSVDFDGSNMCGALDDDADEAFEEIARIVEDFTWTSEAEVWDAEEWLSAQSDEKTATDLGLAADATDADKARATQEIEAIAKSDGQRLHGADRAIDDLVARLKFAREEAEDA